MTRKSVALYYYANYPDPGGEGKRPTTWKDAQQN
jgi:hypothetical protein